MRKNASRRKNPPGTIWVLFDRSNGDCGYGTGDEARNYVWFFYSRQSARAHKKRHDQNPAYSRLEGPYRYKSVPEMKKLDKFFENYAKSMKGR